jgi:hypothetical protein
MSGTDRALLVAENEGKVAAICLPDSPFNVAFEDCESCLTAYRTSPKTENSTLIASLNDVLSYCNDGSGLASFSSLLSVEAGLSITQASLCSVNDITSDCPTTSSGNATVATISSKPAAVSTLVAASSAATNHSPLNSAGAIAGVAVACTLAVVLIIALVIFLCFRRHKRHKQDKIRKAEIASRQEDKAQLHSEDLKPIRKELSGDQPLASKKDVPIAEMPANEDPQRTTGEMPANEVVGTELQGESNEERDEENGSSQSN